jgi:hypothetical protein
MSHTIKGREVASIMKQRMALPDRINAFMSKYDLATAGFCLVVSTAEQTLRSWINKKAIAPGAMIALMNGLEECEELRDLLGVTRYRSKMSRRNEANRAKPGTGKRGRPAKQKEPASNAPAAFDEELFVEGPMSWTVNVPGTDG